MPSRGSDIDVASRPLRTHGWLIRHASIRLPRLAGRRCYGAGGGQPAAGRLTRRFSFPDLAERQRRAGGLTCAGVSECPGARGCAAVCLCLKAAPHAWRGCRDGVKAGWYVHRGLRERPLIAARWARGIIICGDGPGGAGSSSQPSAYCRWRQQAAIRVPAIREPPRNVAESEEALSQRGNCSRFCQAALAEEPRHGVVGANMRVPVRCGALAFTPRANR